MTDQSTVYDILLALGPVISFLTAGLLGFLGGTYSRQKWIFRGLILFGALAVLFCQLGLAYGFGKGIRTPALNLFKWSPLPDFGVEVAFRGDLYSFFFSLPLTLLTLLLVIYLLARQPDPESGEGVKRGRLYALLFLMEGAGLAAFYSADLVMFFLWVEAVNLILFLLSGPGIHGASSSKFSYQSYSASFFAGILILAPLLVIVSRNGGTARYNLISVATVDTLLFGLISAGGLAKAAQFPFQVLFGKFGGKELPVAAEVLAGVGILLPLGVYLPGRLQIIVGSGQNLFEALSWMYLFTGSLTVLCCAWLALREVSLVRKAGYLTTSSFGFVVLAFGTGNITAAFLQLLSLIVAGPLLLLSAELLEIEISPPPPDPKNAARSIAIRRPPFFRINLAFFYFLGAIGVIGLPFSPAFAARWQILAELLSMGYRFYFGLALTAVVLMGFSTASGFAYFLLEPRRTEEEAGVLKLWVPLFVPAVLGLALMGFGVAPAVGIDWVKTLNGRINLTQETNGLESILFVPQSLNVLLLILLLASGALIWKAAKKSGRELELSWVPVFNGGLLYGHEADEDLKQRISRNQAIVLAEEEEVLGFEDEFFKVGLSNFAPPPPKILPHMGSSDYFGPVMGRLTEAYKLLDTTYSGRFFVSILFYVLIFTRKVLEWLTERFYPALAAFIMLIFIFLLTR